MFEQSRQKTAHFLSLFVKNTYIWKQIILLWKYINSLGKIANLVIDSWRNRHTRANTRIGGVITGMQNAGWKPVITASHSVHLYQAPVDAEFMFLCSSNQSAVSWGQSYTSPYDLLVPRRCSLVLGALEVVGLLQTTKQAPRSPFPVSWDEAAAYLCIRHTEVLLYALRTSKSCQRERVNLVSRMFIEDLWNSVKIESEFATTNNDNVDSLPQKNSRKKNVPGVAWTVLFLTDRKETKLEWRRKKHSASVVYHDSRFSYNWLTILTLNDLPWVSYTAGTSREVVDSNFNIKSFKYPLCLNQTVQPSN